MKRSQYERMTEAALKGLRVVSNKPLRNGSARLPAGTIFTIERKFGGFGLKSDPCRTCGIQIWITKVPPGAVDLLEETEK